MSGETFDETGTIAAPYGISAFDSLPEHFSFEDLPRVVQGYLSAAFTGWRTYVGRYRSEDRYTRFTDLDPICIVQAIEDLRAYQAWLGRDFPLDTRSDGAVFHRLRSRGEFDGVDCPCLPPMEPFQGDGDKVTLRETAAPAIGAQPGERSFVIVLEDPVEGDWSPWSVNAPDLASAIAKARAAWFEWLEIDPIDEDEAEDPPEVVKAYTGWIGERLEWKEPKS